MARRLMLSPCLCVLLVCVVWTTKAQSNSPCSSHSPIAQYLTAYTSLGKFLRSPYYPGTYPTSTTCLWRITASSGVVKLTFSSFDLEESTGCAADYLEVLDVSQLMEEKIIGKFCGSVSPVVIYSSGSTLGLKLVSDSFETGKGFHLLYQAVPSANASAFCSPSKSNDRLKFTASYGEIYSPNYPAPYPSSITCTWTLTVPDGQSVKLVFDDFDVGSPYSKKDCSDDQDAYVEVRDGQSYMSSKKGRYCTPQSKPATQVSSGRYMWVQFFAPYKEYNSKGGFKAHFNAVDVKTLFVTGVCHPSAPDSFNNNLRLTGSSGTLHSPDYPSKYPPSMSCVWVITVPNGKRVKLTFDDFSTESNYPCGGNGDFVEVRDGRYSYSRKTGTYCGKSTPSVVRSSDRYMWVKFNSDSDSATYRGFKAHYKAEDKESPWTIIGAVAVAACGFFVVVICCCVFCVKKRQTQGRAARPSTSTALTTVGQQQPPPFPHQPETYPQGNISYPSSPVGYMPQQHFGMTPYPPKSPPAYSDVPPPPYPGLGDSTSAVPQYPPPGQAYPWQ